ncbi:MAG: CocE/NonD family hydrolase [Proteobacteria bacterium]|nr:CocE/NonD family hydrolase [Pseudomonadota bacterium]
MIVAHNVMVPMRDGVGLATDIYRPAREDGSPTPGQLPAILVRTSYDKSSATMVVDPVARFFTRHGYAVALQDLRGRGLSEGTGQYFHMANVNEGEDGYDTIEWLACQSWSNGRIGMVGSSHLGIVQNVAALHRPPHLKAIWADVAMTKAIDWTCRQGGAAALQMFGALFLHGHDAQELHANPAGRKRIERAVERLRDEIAQAPFRPGMTALAAVPNLEEVWFKYYCNGVYDDWWGMEVLDQRRQIHRFADIPVTLSSGWYDPFPEDAAWQYVQLARQNRSATRLILGPWNHLTMRGAGQSHVVEVDFGADAKWGDAVYNAERLRWFDRWLKDRDTGVEREAPVRIFVMGGGSGRKTQAGHLDHGGHWRREPAWPLARAEITPYFLGAGGGLARERPPADASPVVWTHDPEHPVPTIGAAVTGFYEWTPVPPGIDPSYLLPRSRMRTMVPDGPMHQRERPELVGCRPPFPLLAARPDVQVFQTELLTDDLEVTGTIEVKLWVASSAVDTDVTAKLIDVHPPNIDYPEGFHMNLVDSILRGRFRNGLSREEMLEPGRAYEFTIPLPPIANLFKAGHRIRLDVASSNFPRFDVNPGTGEKLGRHTRQVPARNTLYFDRRHPSRLLLPIIASA